MPLTPPPLPSGLLSAGLSAALELALNQILKLDPDTPTRLQPLSGKVLGVQLRGITPPLFLAFSATRIDVLNHYEGQPDCSVRVHPRALRQLPDQLTQAIKQGDLDLDGDLQSAQQLAQLLMSLHIDPEEQLSRLTGDIIAHQLLAQLRLLGQLLHDRQQLLHSNLGELLHEEARLAPSALEQAWFIDEVAQLHSDLEQLEQRIERLMSPEAAWNR